MFSKPGTLSVNFDYLAIFFFCQRIIQARKLKLSRKVQFLATDQKSPQISSIFSNFLYFFIQKFWSPKSIGWEKNILALEKTFSGFSFSSFRVYPNPDRNRNKENNSWKLFFSTLMTFLLEKNKKKLNINEFNIPVIRQKVFSFINFFGNFWIFI